MIKGTSCILVLNEEHVNMGEERPCIGCARCVEVCPMGLMPTAIDRLVQYERWEETKDCGILDCMECGSCSYICPAKRMLVERIKFGKARLAAIRAQEQAKQQAESA